MARTSKSVVAVVLALLLPFITCWLQWQFWSIFKPFVWFLFFPTVFFSSRIGGKSAGIVSTVISALLVIFCFIPPQLSFVSKNPDNLYSVVVFLFMGILFSLTHDRLEQAKRRVVEAQEASRIANEQEATLELLRICNAADSLSDLMGELMRFFQKISGCEAIGVRLRDGDEFPYYVTQGFSKEFVLAENNLCAFDQQGELIRDQSGHPALDCMCGNILCSRVDPSKPFFTPHGSFWSSCTSELLATTSDADRQATTRNRCNGEGYESVALIPLRYHNETYGLFQFNDRRKGRFTPEKIALYENLVDYISIALSKLRSDDALRETSERFRMIFEHSIDAIMLTRTDGTILVANPEASRIFGLSEEEICRAGRPGLVDMDDSRTAELLEQQRVTGRCRGEITMIRGDGSRFPAEISSAVFSDQGDVQKTSLIIRDITERKSLENQLRQAQKMEAVGQLAGGVAHDFNNIMQIIMGNAQLQSMFNKKHDQDCRYVDEIFNAIERGASLTRSLLVFSRKQAIELTCFDLGDLIRESLKLARRLVTEDISVCLEGDGQPLDIKGDAGLVQHVVFNLVTNARDAIAHQGTITISTKAVNLDRDFIALQGIESPEGRYALLVVKDTGCGINDEIRDKIFEPFFTTKEAGKGTGLGLAMIYGTVRQMDGFIEVDSQPGLGTAFKIYLPLTDEQSVVPAISDPSQNLSGKGESLLIVEDDQGVRDSLTQILTMSDYRVMCATTADEAVMLVCEHASDIKLAIMDVILSGMNGMETTRVIHEILPDLPILFLSGYSDELLKARGIDDYHLHKPVHPVQLLSHVRQLLDGSVADSTGHGVAR